MRSCSARIISMTEAAGIKVEVACALPEHQKILRIDVPEGTTARGAIELSGLQAEFPEVDMASSALGVFGSAVADTHVLKAGDRVEVYRPLLNNPRDERRKLAARGEVMGKRSD